MHSAKASWSKGFTLVELAVTVAVLAILLAAAGPSFTDFFERYRLRSAVDDTVNLLSMARQGAVEADRSVTVKFSDDLANWCVGGIQQAEPAVGQLVPTTPAACDCSTPTTCQVNGETLVVDGTERPGVSLAAAVSSFTYDSKDGILAPTGASRTVEFVSPSDRYRIRVLVTPLGHSRTCVPSDKRPIPGFPACAG